MGKVFAFDIGIASVGWAVVDNNSYKVEECGSNIFEAANAENNIARRSKRQLRRLHRRQQTRIEDFNKLWESMICKISDDKINDILSLRIKGLNEPLTNEELYAVLRYMLKHRGISYLDDALDESLKGKSDYEKGIQRNQEELKEKLPCMIQMERFNNNNSYRGNSVYGEGDNRIVLSNIFTTGSYEKEITTLLNKQKEYNSSVSDYFIERYLSIFRRKRKYYDGPGNELSRTDYGKYTTEWIKEENKYKTDDNIFDKLIGKCTIYSDELRAAASSYTAQEFNALNDLNNLVINGRKLDKDEKKKIISCYINEKTVFLSGKAIRKIIESAIGETIEELSGARVNKDDEEIFHSFELIRKMRKAGVETEKFSREDFDELADILTRNNDKESIEEGLNKSYITLSGEDKDRIISFRKTNSSYFTKWHSFSIRLMKELIPEMYEQPKEQMTLLTDMGLLKNNIEKYKGLTKIPYDDILDDIYNPVVKRSIRITIDVLNALLKKYGNPDNIVIEMPRDNNSDEEKKRIKDEQSRNEKELKTILNKIQNDYGLDYNIESLPKKKGLILKLKLWNEQDGLSLYSGKTIDIEQLIKDPSAYEIDHAIPRSISLDDSRSNKVLVFSIENQEKGNMTPYQYLTGGRSNGWDFEKYKAKVLEIGRKKEYGYSRKKIENLLFSMDITKLEVVQGFINRNLNDTRYASRVVLNTIQDYFKANDFDTKVSVIRGSFTHQMRVNLEIVKDREEDFSHHAVDAALIAFSKLGYDSYKKICNDVIDFETGEILDEKQAKYLLSEDGYADYNYQRKWHQIKEELEASKQNVKYWHRVDKKANRSLSNDTIRGTREYDGKTFKINKIDIHDKKAVKEVFVKKIKAGKSNDFLMARNDPKTFDILCEICDEFKDTDNPFTAYEKETGDYVRKYAKNGKGPIINTLKYIDGEVGSCIDISHKYGHKNGSKKVVLENCKPLRMDVYKNIKTNKYFLIGIKYSDCKYQNGKYVLDTEKYLNELIREGVLKEDDSLQDLESRGMEFVLSFYKNEFIQYEKDGKTYTERFLSRTMPNQKNYIETKPIDKQKYDKQNLVGLGKTSKIIKIRVDILGNRHYCENETFNINLC